MTEEQLGRSERVTGIVNNQEVNEMSAERILDEQIDNLLALTHRALQHNDNSALSRYLSSIVPGIALARFRLGGASDTGELRSMVDSVTEKLSNIDAQILDYGKMIDALLDSNKKTTSTSTAMLYHEEIRKLEEIREELKRPN